MIDFFYRNRNIAGLILVLAPVIAFTAALPAESFSSYSFLAASMGISAASACYRKLPLRLWTGLFCSVFILSAVFSSYSTFLTLIASASGAGLAFILPPNIITGWFRLSKNRVLAAVWIFSASIGLACTSLAVNHTYAAAPASLAVMLAGALFFIEKPFFAEAKYSLTSGLSYFSKKFSTASKAFLFIFFISFVSAFSAGSVCYMNPAYQSFLRSGANSSLILFCGMISGIVIASLQAEKKGIYSCFITLIFAAQFLAFLLCFENNKSISALISFLLSSAVFSSLLLIIPLMSYYLCWSSDYSLWNSAISAAVPLGVFASSHALIIAEKNIIRADNFIILIMCMLAASFFIVFSAWKHRFTLLR